MNIWCISKYASLPKYGTGARLFFLAKEFNRLEHKTVLFTSDSNHLAKFPLTDNVYNFENLGTITVCWIKTKKYTKTASIDRILSWFDFEKKLFSFPKDKFTKPDIVIASSLSILTVIYGYYLKKKYNTFLIFEIRDIWPLTMTEEGGFNKWHPLVLFLGCVEKFGYKKADLIVGTMPKLDLHVKNILGYDKPFFCSPLGFNQDDYNKVIKKDKNPFNTIFPKNKIIIGYAGSMGITNSLEAYMKAIELLKNDKNIHFMLVGSGALKEDFQKQLSQCSNVSFLPRMEQKLVKYFLDKCDILYLSTKNSIVWDYGQSMNKVIEYMLAAKPIIASYSGYPSMINEANCGYFIKTNNAEDVKNVLLEVTSLNQEQREEMGRNGKKWIYENRPYSLLAKQYLEAIQNQIKKKHA